MKGEENMELEYKDLATVAGKGGLFRVLTPTRAGVILETLDSDKKRFVAGIHHKVSILDEISVYTHSTEGSKPLSEVFIDVYREFKDNTDLDSKSDPAELRAFFKHIIPDYDEDRVYTSDIKKIINWYNQLVKIAPDLVSGKTAKKNAKKEEKDTEPKSKKTAKGDGATEKVKTKKPRKKAPPRKADPNKDTSGKPQSQK